MGKTRGKGRGQGGFTLLEIAATFLFVSIVFAAVFSGSSPVAPTLENAYVLRAHNFLEAARDAALVSGRDVHVAFSSTGGAACQAAASCAVGDPAAIPFVDAYGRPIELKAPNGRLLQGGPAAAVFKPDGTVSGWARLTVGGTAIDVDATTGRAE